MKYKENNFAFFLLYAIFALAGFFIQKVFSFIDYGIQPYMQIIVVAILCTFVLKEFADNKIVMLISALLTFTILAELSVITPLFLSLVLFIVHAQLFPIENITFTNLYQLIPVYYCFYIFLIHKKLSLMINSASIKKKSIIHIENEKTFLNSLPKNTDDISYDIVAGGSISFMKNTETILLKASNLSDLKNATFLLKDKRNTNIFFRGARYLITANNLRIINNGKGLLVEIHQNPNFITKLMGKKKETFVYAFSLNEIDEFLISKIFEIARYEVQTNQDSVVNAVEKEEILKAPLEVKAEIISSPVMEKDIDDSISKSENDKS